MPFLPTLAQRSLKARWAALEVHEPTLSGAEAARRLGVTPVELAAARTFDGFRRLGDERTAIASHLCAFGRVVVRAEAPGCALEVAGTFAAPQVRGEQLSFDGPEITLHADLRRWQSTWAFERLGRVRTERGLVAFATDGEAAWTIDLVPGSNRGVLDAFLDVFGELEPRDERPVAPPRACATLEELARDWHATGRSNLLQHLLWRHGLGASRVERLARDQRAERVDRDCVFALLEASASSRHVLLATCGGTAATLSGRLHGVPTRAGDWWNVVGSEGALHLRPEAIGEVWRVLGPRSSLELFDHERRPLLTLADGCLQTSRDSLPWTRLLLALPQR